MKGYMMMRSIQIDDKVWNYLKKFAEPLEDTPNSVISRLLFGGTKNKSGIDFANINIQGVPKALSQIFEVLYEMECKGLSRIEATHCVAEKRGTTPQTIIDKYCRQLNKRAHQIDALFSEPSYTGFKALLQNKYTQHSNVIDIFFDTLGCDHPPPETQDEDFILEELNFSVNKEFD